MKVSGWTVSALELLARIGRAWWTIVAGANVGLTLALAAVTVGDTPAGSLAIITVGLAVGLALFVGPVVVRALVEPEVGSYQSLEPISGVTVLTTLPTLDLRTERRTRRRLQIRNALLAISTTVPCVIAILLLIRFES